MHNPLTEAERAALRDELARPEYTGLTDHAAWEWLHARPLIANPVAPSLVPKPFLAVDLITAIAEGHRSDIKPFLGDVAPYIASQNRNGIRMWSGALKLVLVLDQADVTAIFAVLDATQPDPSWPALVPGPSRRDLLFPGRVWTEEDPRSTDFGASVNFVPLAAITEARNA